MTNTLPTWQANLLQNPNGNVTKISNPTKFSFQLCIPQPNNPQLCIGDWYMKNKILCPFTRPVCPTNSTYIEDSTQKSKGYCECNTYMSSADGKTKQYFGDICQYGDNTTCNGGGLVNKDGTCTCNPGYEDSTCNCTLDLTKFKTYTYLMNGKLGSIELENVKITITLKYDVANDHDPYWTTDYNDSTTIVLLWNSGFLTLFSKDGSVTMDYFTPIFPCRNITWIPADTTTFTNIYFTTV
jgi:hypothetical protein